eukprot:CAMPEP_0117423272 /NCGR_PEP_ID=MMETSP0758-20121206/3936_1 /TAXON_ID=63605 /ORGANISM="Percolomonas cosmopolitus, Strain AE-1 (ATCC 50343)" /LENGTH=84 /DNA_ID=CAMNT_0005206375 /DNA_START=262 /DNA_END=516 /DNA_ORIENTATION=-
MSKYDIFQHPISSNQIMRMIEENNTIVFAVSRAATKREIKAAFKAMYDSDVATVRTLIRPDGQKTAYIKVTDSAVEVANKIGLV